MSIFVCVADESHDEKKEKVFVFGGYSAPESAWNEIADVWQEDVLDGPPKLDACHATELASISGRRKLGIDVLDAKERLDEAARILCSHGGLIPVGIIFNPSFYKIAFRRLLMELRPVNVSKKKPPQRRTPVPLDPDVQAYIWFCMRQLEHIYENYPECEKVNFWIEENGKISKIIKDDIHDNLVSMLEYIGLNHLIPLVGICEPKSKVRIQCQAADMFAWHLYQMETKRDRVPNSVGSRYEKMIKMTETRGRIGSIIEVDEKQLRAMSARMHRSGRHLAKQRREAAKSLKS